MIGANHVQVWLATTPVDMRRSFDGLAEHVRSFLGHDPLSGSLFVFRNRAGHMLKILWWDRDGLAIYYKRLERGAFQLPCGAHDQKVVSIDRTALMRLLHGLKMEARTRPASQ